jgi:transposase
VVDALGLPLTFEITEGQRHDSVPAKELIARALSQCLLADKAYDSGSFRTALSERGCAPVIPSNGSRAVKLPYDKELYKARSEIECTFSQAQAGASIRYALREDLAQLHRRGRHRMRPAVAANLTLLFAALGQPDEHRHEAHHHLFARSMTALVKQLELQAYIEKGRGLRCRASRR